MKIVMQQYVLAWFGGRRARAVFMVGLVVAAMAASALAGAWIEARRPIPIAGPSVAQQAAIGKQISRDRLYIQENVRLLADKVGKLQARLVSLDVLAKRVVDAADIDYTNPEIQASFHQASFGAAPMLGGPDGARALGGRVAALEKQMSAQADRFNMVDLVLTRRAAAQARLPTLVPVKYTYLSAPFGWRRNPVTGRHAMHDGIDLAAPKGTPVKAASGGIVVKAGRESGYGKMVEISHGNGLDTLYAHASRIEVKVGDLVKKGQTIALVGSTGRATGPHLHFEVRMAGHPLDPTLFLHKSATHRLLASAPGRQG